MSVGEIQDGYTREGGRRGVVETVEVPPEMWGYLVMNVHVSGCSACRKSRRIAAASGCVAILNGLVCRDAIKEGMSLVREGKTNSTESIS